MRDIRVSYWGVDNNSDLLAIKEVKEVYDRFGEEKSSRVMWGIELIWGYDSKFSSLPEDERIRILEEDYIGEVGFYGKHKGILGVIIEKYKKVMESSELRYVRSWEAKVEERRRYMEGLKYNDENWKKLDEMLMKSSEILEQKKVIMSLVKKDSGVKIKGNLKLSLLAERKIKGEKL